MTDAALITLLERREEEALLYLKERYEQECFSIALRLLRSEEEAEECVNDVWMQLWNSIPPTRPENLRCYIAKTVRNTALHRLERQSAQKRSAVLVLLDELSECIPDPLREREAEARELREFLNGFVRSLRREEQQIFLRRYWYGERIDELAVRFGCSESRVNGILFRIRKKLRRELEKEGMQP